jgi:hypothetical protein
MNAGKHLMNGLVIIVTQSLYCNLLVELIMQQLDEQLFKNVVDDTKIPIRIAFIKPDGSPNILSLWYEQIDGKLLLTNPLTKDLGETELPKSFLMMEKKYFRY